MVLLDETYPDNSGKTRPSGFVFTLKRLGFLVTTPLVPPTKTKTTTYSMTMVNKSALSQTNRKHWHFCLPADKTCLVFSCHK